MENLKKPKYFCCWQFIIPTESDDSKKANGQEIECNIDEWIFVGGEADGKKTKK